jgi:CheY-like chemotaxis protein
MDGSFMDHLRLSSDQRRKLLGHLDRSPGKQLKKCRRRHPRWEYRALDIAVSVTHPGGGHSRLLVCSRNLSAGGISFLHGGYLHAGSECTVVLMRRDGVAITLAGVIRHCRYLQGTCHEAGIQFDHEIDPHAILLPSNLSEAANEAKLNRSMQIPSFTGRVLLADDSESDRRLFAHQLAATGLAITAVATSGAALDAMQRWSFDAVICGLDLDGGGGIYAVRRLRDRGYQGPILVFTAEVSTEALARVQAAGADEVLGKPYDPGYAMYLLGEWLRQPTPNSAILSRFDDEPDMAGLLAEFIEETQRLAHRLAKAMENEQFAVVRELCLRMAGSGSNHGFDQLGVAARDAMRALDTVGEVSAAVGPLRRLVSICQRMRSSRSVPLPRSS